MPVYDSLCNPRMPTNPPRVQAPLLLAHLVQLLLQAIWRVEERLSAAHWLPARMQIDEVQPLLCADRAVHARHRLLHEDHVVDLARKLLQPRAISEVAALLARLLALGHPPCHLGELVGVTADLHLPGLKLRARLLDGHRASRLHQDVRDLGHPLVDHLLDRQVLCRLRKAVQQAHGADAPRRAGRAHGARPNVQRGRAAEQQQERGRGHSSLL
mmetsp:Transcript_11735/g.38848  ORF Transcript_11735/g.38848 Transcript_11735/m.38848 type:complete len:214 (-) Transcript_11735:9-650(-)|eukprot:CAMPEP_0196673314 /NCGR_PEP_ID=MMETSP1090-20130531/2879_1 /TAXON_ID=37098 /ORGANISM="Isochrysis sp, Strain CCMP1244" /LENGTH=213 /DNA_ID=CAMNT_0042011069 /DNA_START=91 /DNA_END=732 /DNA_ORIENTATION=-